MDEETLFGHRQLWGKEEQQYASNELPLLTHDEQKLYNALKSHIWGQNIRLEQERIFWNMAWKVMTKPLDKCPQKLVYFPISQGTAD